MQSLYYFQKIAECGQYTLAAEELHVTQATLSYAISNMEHELNVKLFNRKGKNLVLTPCGKAYLSCVHDALQALARGEQMIRNFSNPDKVIIKLSYLESLEEIIPGLISNLSASEQDVPVRFDLAHYPALFIEQRLIRHEIDLGISTMPTCEGISAHIVGHQDNVVIVPKHHPWAEQESVPLSALNRKTFITYSHDCAIRRYYDSILESSHVYPDIFAEARYDSNVLDMVSNNIGVAIVPRMKRLEYYDLSVVPIKDKIPPRAIYLLWSTHSSMSPQVDYFRQHIIACADPPFCL